MRGRKSPVCPLSCCLFTRDRQTLRSYTGILSSRGSSSAPPTVDSMCLGRSVCETWTTAAERRNSIKSFSINCWFIRSKFSVMLEGWSCFCYLVHWFWESFLFMNHILHVKESFKFALWIYQLLFHKNSMRWLSRKILQYFRQKCNCNFCVWCSLVFAVLQIKKIDS